MNILFWNVYQKALDECLLNIIIEKNCDLISLAEYPNEIESLCSKLNLYSREGYKVVPNYGGCQKIKALIKKEYHVESLLEQSRYHIALIQTAAFKLVIAMMHNASKLHATMEEQKENLRYLHYDIEKIEEKNQTRNVLIMGDLNVNPFEEACIAANTIHAIPYVEEINENGRQVQNRIYKEFYNPMWKFLGRPDPPYGTYFYNNSNMINYFWNIFDQFLIRPELIDSLDKDSLEIITTAGDTSLLKKNYKPNKQKYSDHLPIYVRLKGEKIYG